MFCRKCGNKLTDDSAFCNKCGEPVEAGVAAQTATVPQRVDNSIDKLSTEETKEYMKNVCQLENDRYALKNTRDDLQRKVDTYGKKRNIIKPNVSENLKCMVGGILSAVEMFVGSIVVAYILTIIICAVKYKGVSIVGRIVNSIFWFSYDKYCFTYWYGLIIAGGVISGIFAIVVIFKELKGHSNAKCEYDKKVKEDKARVKHELSCIPVFKAHMADIDRNIAELTKTIDEVYSYDILYPKYRNDVVAVNTIYEYFITGRASSLSAKFGNDGAYNIYENELRQNIIINKLDTIINQLEQIKANQHMLYEAVQEACMVSAKIADMAEHISSIDQNTALSAYYSKVSADNTATLNYMALMSM
ncbi:zinc ribbon domain-containing protein [uncultured Ruminococcus sp.]|uniref:zinc ribbon domain-containing protein n=1 Tax=uncultured Ruminococcus sp. TaxID=165186 RepID=UPI0025CE634F|nr:zinc ribbon domain-containing protein [uncultured Ruminococcus sp.]